MTSTSAALRAPSRIFAPLCQPVLGQHEGSLPPPLSAKEPRCSFRTPINSSIITRTVTRWF